MEPEKLKDKAHSLPDSPGVYLMKDEQGRVIYIGKAKSLPKRVVTYFQKSLASTKTARLVSQVDDLDYMVTDTEKEAMLLENSLIKKHKPRYNIILRDDKTYPYLRLTVPEPYPRLEVVRRIKKDGAEYFGPFSSATAMRQTLRLIRTLFPIRQCKRSDVQAVERPCLNFQLGRCLGPCHGGATQDEYRAMIDELITFFKGRDKTLTGILRRKMKDASDRLDFEAAARYRDRLAWVAKTLEKQRTASIEQVDRDVFGLARDRGQMVCTILFIRRGTLLGSRNIYLGARSEPEEEVIDSLLVQYYSQDNFIPDEILVPVKMDNQALIEDWLKEKHGKAVKIFSPHRGDKKKLLDLAIQNAVTALAERLRAAELGVGAIEELQKKLLLPGPPRRIEGYDMSTLHGDAPVGAMVVLEDGKWVKSDYRRFRIKTANGRDDYAMMAEVLGRRLVKEELPRPDLILLDGGRGQLGVTLAMIEDLGIKDPPPLAGLAKGREGESDRVWLPGRKNPADLKADSSGLLLLMRIRDEAHRYVQAYHHRLRARKVSRSELDDIPGIGPARRKALLKYFGTLTAVKNAPLEELTAVEGMSRTAAEAVFNHFRPMPPNE